MNVLLVLAHPERLSFNGAMFDVAQTTLENAGHTVVTSDLYRMGFDPVSSRHNFTSVHNPDYLKIQAEEQLASETDGFADEVEAEIAKVEAADLMIWQFPLWWFGLPAILKGWVDRVFAMGRAYGNGHIYETGKFKGKRALLSLTTGGRLSGKRFQRRPECHPQAHTTRHSEFHWLLSIAATIGLWAGARGRCAKASLACAMGAAAT